MAPVGWYLLRFHRCRTWLNQRSWIGAFYYWAGSDSFTKVDVVIDDYSKFSNTNQIEVVFNGKTAVLTKTKCTDYSDTVGNTQCEFKISGNPFDMTKNYSGELKVSIKNN